MDPFDHPFRNIRKVMYPRLCRELVLPILRTSGSLRNKLRMVSTDRFHASASSKGVKCLSLVIEFVVLASNCSPEIGVGTLTEPQIRRSFRLREFREHCIERHGLNPNDAERICWFNLEVFTLTIVPKR